MVKELLFANAYLSKVVDDKMLWFTQMEVLDFIYAQFLFTTNSLERQPTTLQYFQPPAPLTLALAATAIHCVLSEYASGKKATVMFSQNEYQATFGPSPMINFTLEATTQSITHQRRLRTFAPPMQHNSTILVAHQSSSELVCLDWTSSISFHSQFLLSQLPSMPFRTLYLPIRAAPSGIRAAPSHAELYTCLSTLLSPEWELFDSHWRFYNAFHTPYPPLFGAPPLGEALLNPISAPPLG